MKTKDQAPTWAVYGGSFDPPHVGHVLAAHYLLSVADVQRVVIVPVFAHALNKELSSYEKRVRMCELAFADDPRIVISQIEAQLPRPSYTLHTVKALQETHPEVRLRLVVGADVLHETHRWHEFDEVQKRAPLLVLGRRGVPHQDAPPAFLPEISSTQLRELLVNWNKTRDESSLRALEQRIPRAALRFILDNQIYASGP